MALRRAFARLGFTPRECDVLHWLTQGKANDEIARILRLRTDSVSRYLQGIYDKMGVDNRVAATICALNLARKVHAQQLAVRGGEVSLSVCTNPHTVYA